VENGAKVLGSLLPNDSILELPPSFQKVWYKMKFPKYSIRQWVSIGLFVLGFFSPAFSIYHNRQETGDYRLLRFLAMYRLYQWLPLAVLFWLCAAYAWSDDRFWRVTVWVVFVVGLYLSGISWLQASLP
jgi:hypothetical protein